MSQWYRVTESSNKLVTAAKRAVEEVRDTAECVDAIDTVAGAAGTTPTDGRVGTLATAFAIRRAVFVGEQGVDPTLEWDDADGDATHILVVDDTENRPVSVARTRLLDDETVKVERVAVRQSARGAGWGRRVMDAAEAVGIDAGASRCVLHAQRRVEGFYHELGYRTVSDEFEEAGRPHVEMATELPR